MPHPLRACRSDSGMELCSAINAGRAIYCISPLQELPALLDSRPCLPCSSLLSPRELRNWVFSACLSACSPACLSVCLSDFLCAHLSVSACLSARLSVRLSACLLVCLPVCLCPLLSSSFYSTAGTLYLLTLTNRRFPLVFFQPPFVISALNRRKLKFRGSVTQPSCTTSQQQS